VGKCPRPYRRINVGDERERRMQDEEPDVEAHRRHLNPDAAEKDEGSKDDDEPDVEAHVNKR
jgi:hypothetical protein